MRTRDAQRLIDLVFDRHMSIRAACDTLGLQPSLGYGIVRLFLDENRREARRSIKVFRWRLKLCIKGFVKDKPGISLLGLKRRVKSRLGISVSSTTIRRVLKRGGLLCTKKNSTEDAILEAAPRKLNRQITRRDMSGLRLIRERTSPSP